MNFTQKLQMLHSTFLVIHLFNQTPNFNF